MRSNSSSSEKFSDYQRKDVLLVLSKLIHAIIRFNVNIEVFSRFYLMCDYILVILCLIIILLTFDILLLLYLLTAKICL